MFKPKSPSESVSNHLQADEETRVRILAETAKIAWKELQRYFAQGVVVMVRPDLNLVDVAYEVTQDNELQVKCWMEAGKLQNVPDNQAREWLDANALMWAVVVKPWVLVQPVMKQNSIDK